MARTVTVLLALPGLLLFTPTFADARRCAAGSFVVEPAALVTGTGPVLDAVAIDGLHVSLAGCGPARLHVRRAPGGMALRARWASCDGIAGAVQLKARVDRACGQMTGVVRARRAAGRWPFRAARIGTCGNGVREGDEACDQTGPCCSATCTRTDAPGCAPACDATATAAASCDAASFCDGCGAGVCRQRPATCVGVLAPVCGCDGRTYVNACEAARAGVGVRAPGHCGPDACTTNVECDDGEYCQARPGRCDDPGACVGRPTTCTRELNPVCGCDGHTYPNPCAAATAGVRIGTPGACDCPRIPCPSGAVLVDSDGDGCEDACRAPCADACDCYRVLGPGFPGPCPLDCASCDNYWVCDAGFCAPRCGPVPPGHDTCEPPPGCTDDAECKAGERCAKAAGDCGGTGHCEPGRRGDACIQVYDPVCGCDGRTYGNACMALVAGVNVASHGACTQRCGTIAGLGCPDGQLCDLDPGQCHTSDAAGTCVDPRALCTEIRHPVCGCDGHTYASNCDRRAHGVSQAHDGPCCVVAIDCVPGFDPVDTDGDGCIDSCRPH